MSSGIAKGVRVVGEKFAIFLFTDEEMCMVHAFLYVKELNEKGIEAKLILEGKATAVPKLYADGKGLVGKWYSVAKENGWIDCTCKACSAVTGSLEAAEKEGLRICSDLNGHVSMEKYVSQGYRIIVL